MELFREATLHFIEKNLRSTRKRLRDVATQHTMRLRAPRLHSFYSKLWI